MTTSHERTLLVGATPLAGRIAREVMAAHSRKHRILGIVADAAGGEVDAAASELIVGPLSRLEALVDELQPDRIVIAMTDRRGRLPMSALLAARVSGVAVEDAVCFYERLTGKIAIESLTPHDLIASSGFRTRRVELAFGRMVSLIVSGLALVVLAPFFALIAAAIKLDSPGPIWFVQPRVGLRGRPLNLIKFRTMRPEPAPISEWACDNGYRITRVGSWLRRYRLDELPQLVNVLRGEMNLVGPRPHPACNVALFTANIPYYALRSVVRPGLTGWAQVRQGYANGLDEETEKMRYDLYYIKHISAWLDIRILFRTVIAVVAGDRKPSNAAPVPRPAATTIARTARPQLEV
jgi:exopolysaccharide biosynthesis polyprenyl glycosylphosphotransferase